MLKSGDQKIPQSYELLYKNSAKYDYEGDLNELSDSQLRSLWKKYWRGSQTYFTKLYGINHKNFVNWINGKQEESPRTSKVVRSYLSTLRDNYKADNPSADKLYVIKKSIDVLLKFIDSIESSIALLVFIAIDNSTHMLDYLPNMADNIHIILVTSKPHSVDLSRINHQKQFSLVKSKTTAKNADDIVLTIIATALNLQVFYDIPFLFISNDGFIDELLVSLTTIVNRKCWAYHPDNELNKIVEIIQGQ